ncbi:MAG: Na+/H+ antiporter NhaA [Polyangiaceae bacterium]|nr:Na+/H+ antiporter NhaA [Polyangiaceae bacterium]
MRQTDALPAKRDPSAEPPGAWGSARKLVRRALAPVERFLAIEAASGILLVVAAIIALAWANSPWRESYASLWHTPFGVRLGSFAFERDLHFWINDGLMTVFFFVVGLEIRREVHGGDLSDLRRASLPLAAAAGGMIAPALIFLALNRGHASARGWGIPMATDIAFAVGALTLLGKRVVPAQRTLLLALAVIDDVGAILVIALLYSSGVSAVGFMVAGAGVVCILVMQALGVRSPWAYVAPAVIIWAGAYTSGVHPTLAGVAVGLLTPAKAWLGADGFLDRVDANLEGLRENGAADQRAMLPHLDALNAARHEAVSPVERVQHALHGWVAFGIMPLFALANAGVPIGNATLAGDGLRVFIGVAVGLVVGKPIGIMALSWVLVRLRVSRLPAGVGWRRVGVVGSVGGIGFTMALFIAQLAFPAGALLEIAKIAILVGSASAAIAALLAGKLLTEKPTETPASSEAEAEASTSL